MLSLVIIKSLKIKISLNESVKDRTRCPAIQGFVRSIPNFDRTLSVDRPLFAALRSSTIIVRLWISLSQNGQSPLPVTRVPKKMQNGRQNMTTRSMIPKDAKGYMYSK